LFSNHNPPEDLAPMSDQDRITYREFLLSQSVEKIEMAYLRALQGEAEDPVVLVLDLSDRRARAIAEVHVRLETIRRVVAEGRGRDGALLMFWGVPRRWASEFGTSRIPVLDVEIDRIDPGSGFIAVVISSDGASAFAMASPEA
jgi:hypothetical protein